MPMSLEGKRAWARKYRLVKREKGQCFRCTLQAVRGPYCEAHAEENRHRSRGWMRQAYSYGNRYESGVGYKDDHYKFHDAKSQPFFEEDRFGRMQRIVICWDNPLTLLLKLEAMGYDVFHSTVRVA